MPDIVVDRVRAHVEQSRLAPPFVSDVSAHGALHNLTLVVEELLSALENCVRVGDDGSRVTTALARLSDLGVRLPPATRVSVDARRQPTTEAL